METERGLGETDEIDRVHWIPNDGSRIPKKRRLERMQKTGIIGL